MQDGLDNATSKKRKDKQISQQKIKINIKEQTYKIFSLGVFALLFLNRKNSTVNNVEKVKLFVKTLKKATECGMIYKNIFV